MQKKYFFFDIDGTLTSVKNGLVPNSTKKAVQLAKQQGHFVAIATGRPYYFTKAVAEEVGIEHLVCNGGNDLYVNHECIRHTSLDRAFSLAVIDECLKKDISFCVSVEDSLKRITHNDRFTKDLYGDPCIGDLEIIENIDYHQFPQFERIIIAMPAGREKTLDVFQKYPLPMRYHPNSCIIEPDHKDEGIRDMIKQLKGKHEDVVVFGDGRNDIKMFQVAAFSIAMGNAIDEVKNVADYVTKDSDQDGIYEAMKHFGWI
ncbi:MULTISPECIES: HAD family hydrolase [Bacillota]|jgi:HAD superfamily hydrolase (TIGR01484 family)|uniref:HAD-IIB family hydrolase n=3 Tax=Erysipelotrichaceae TaxID=128827 RepID=A0A7G9GMR4_9FIRM|nr:MULTISPECIES: HAD-IIB family hydrolase [Bacillota]QNM12096.1 HAD-IIB family hydrolase [[Eubacterium] hominis]MCH4286551.1 HAD family hydrolase [Amedibacillus hominis]RGB53162.1 HAD-IIB family hydrolase [Absiella sp. AM22-9]RGB59452.1 HAD-IIB family hydrolase [Absiella sp. AM10-20]RGB66575.1 HAD-IIB family hydrolase [Absiella sp. AM09-45]